jgi:signal transduction histidine kinase
MKRTCESEHLKGGSVSIFMRESKNITILTVDDNDALRYSLTRTLKEDGYKVLEARNGAEALRLADDGPDLITLDIHLPDTDGFEICKRLKGNPHTAHIPVLHISATFVEPEYRVRGLETGADGYLAEPISRDELLATVGALLRLKQAERAARANAIEAEKARKELKAAHDELEQRVEERTIQLAQKTEEIRQLTGKILMLQDDERRRLARELHDSTGQMLVAMKMALDQMSEEAKGRKIESLVAETIALNEDMSRQLRTMSYLLHPPLLDEVGLPSALHWYTDGFAQRSGVKVELEMSPDFGRLAADMEIALFRVVQECLTNIHRHSGSTTANIRLSRDLETVLAEIVDTGKGVSPKHLHKGKVIPGVGLMGIQERMRQFGGSVEITSSENGTAVLARIPLKKELQEAV